MPTTSPTRTRAVTVAGVRVAYRESGDPVGPPVLLLHGGGSDASTWDGLAAELSAAGWRVLAADLRGHGHSSRTAGYPLAGYRDDVLGLLDALGLDTVALVGHSLGGYVAVTLAATYPARVSRLVLEDPPVPPREPGRSDPMPPHRRLLLFGGALLRRRRFHPAALAAAVRQLAVADPGWWDGLPAVTAPTLVVSGGPTSHIPPDRLGELVAVIPDARLVTVPVGHRIHSTEPAAFRAAVVPFLRGGRPDPPVSGAR